MNSDFFSRAVSRLQHFPLIVRMLLALAAGALMVPAMPPYGLWPLLFVGFPVFYLILAGLRGWRAFAAGWAFGFGYFSYGLYWIANALKVPGNDYAWVYPFAIAGLPALLALFTAFAAWFIRRCGTDMATLAGYLLFCATLGAAEWLRGHLFTGYPWNLYGYAWAAFLPVAQLAALGGSYFLTLLTIMGAAVPGYALIAPRPAAKNATILTVLAFGLTVAYGFVRLEINPTTYRPDILVRAVQPNIAQEDKWNPRKAVSNFERHLLLSQAKPENAAKTTILVWPETAVPFYMMNDMSARAALRTILEGYEMPVYLVTGLLRRDAVAGASAEDAAFYNSLTVLNRDLDSLAVYDKAHLVPFGEYLPFQKYLPFGPFVQFAGFEAGEGLRTIGVHGLPSFSPLICYEIIFPGAVVEKGTRPEWLVNVTNDGWYGDSMGPRQHFTMAVFRAIEQGVPVIRSANTGISGLVDPVGRVLHKSPLFTTDDTDLPLPKPAPSLNLFSRYGNIVFFVWLAVMFGASSALRRMSGKPKRDHNL